MVNLWRAKTLIRQEGVSHPSPLPEGRGHVKLCPIRRHSRGEREDETTPK